MGTCSVGTVAVREDEKALRGMVVMAAQQNECT